MTDFAKVNFSVGGAKAMSSTIPFLNASSLILRSLCLSKMAHLNGDMVEIAGTLSHG